MDNNFKNFIIKFFSRPETPVLAFLVFLILIISFFTSNFLTLGNLKGILEQVVVISIIALAVNQVIYSAEIDISTGSLLAVCAFVYGFVAIFDSIRFIGEKINERTFIWIYLICSQRSEKLICTLSFVLPIYSTLLSELASLLSYK